MSSHEANGYIGPQAIVERIAGLIVALIKA